MIRISRPHMLRIRFSDEEWTALQEKTQASGLSMSALIRDHLDKIRIHNREDERQHLITLNRINANLNMIARWVNFHKNHAATVQVVSHLIALQRKIAKLIS